MKCKIEGCFSEAVRRGRCKDHIDGLIWSIEQKDKAWDEGAPEGNERAKRTNIVERMIPHYAEIAKTHTPAQIAAMFDGHADTVRRFLNSKGIEIVRHCRKCGTNQPESNFEGPTRRSCNKHEMVRRPNKHTEREWDDAMWMDVRETLRAASCWIATEQGQPNGPYLAVE